MITDGLVIRITGFDVKNLCKQIDLDITEAHGREIIQACANDLVEAVQAAITPILLKQARFQYVWYGQEITRQIQQGGI